MPETGRIDRYNLQRFVDAQRSVYDQALSELRAGQKRSHWMWFIFPQLEGLGHSSTAKYYAISSLDEARDYLNHPILGPRLRACAHLVNQADGRSALQIFGYPDNLKFRSSMTLFSRATEDNAPFLAALDKFFGGVADSVTLNLLDLSQR